jgi:hypothetical protein
MGQTARIRACARPDVKSSDVSVHGEAAPQSSAAARVLEIQPVADLVRRRLVSPWLYLP